MSEIVFKEESYRIMGACFEVYKNLGCGFLEAVYQESLEIEMALQVLPFRVNSPLSLSYKKHTLKQCYVPDFICFEKIIVELKAVKEIDDVHRAQVHNYLKASGHKLGLLVNFGHNPSVEYERIVRQLCFWFFCTSSGISIKLATSNLLQEAIMRQIIAIGLFAFLGVQIIAAPVPKPVPVKSNAEKIVGKWDLVKSSNGLAEGTKCVVELTKDGKMSIAMEFGERTIKYEGTYKFDKDKIDYEVSLNDNKKAEILTIKTVTDDELSVTDPDGIVEEFKRIVEKKEVKEEPKK